MWLWFIGFLFGIIVGLVIFLITTREEDESDEVESIEEMVLVLQNIKLSASSYERKIIDQIIDYISKEE